MVATSREIVPRVLRTRFTNKTWGIQVTVRGIILAGGRGSRLHPITKVVSKQLLPVFDKPMIYYPLSVLMLAGIRDIMIITTDEDQNDFKRLLGDGSQLKINLAYAVQPKPEGLAQAFLIAENFIANNKVALILGDNIFWGVAEFDADCNVTALYEKPVYPNSNYAVTGLYFYDKNAVELAKTIERSQRGEFEVTSLNEIYLKNNKLNIQILGRGFAWLDAGTHESLLEASLFVSTIEKRQGLKIACLEEISWRNGWIDNTELKTLIDQQDKTEYRRYLEKLINGINYQS
jgi:glucose-1-phosphate thymidylyltransferase